MIQRARLLFVLDTNIFIEAHRRYYAQDLCPGFWECLTHYCRKGQILSIDRVRDEIHLNKDSLTAWVKQTPNELFVSSAEQPVVDAFADMMDWVQRNGQFRPEAKAEFASVADGWVAAYAKVHDAIVVTHEVFHAGVRKRVPLPNVCQQFGLGYRNTFEMLREMDVHFDWKHSP